MHYQLSLAAVAVASLCPAAAVACVVLAPIAVFDAELFLWRGQAIDAPTTRRLGSNWIQSPMGRKEGRVL